MWCESFSSDHTIKVAVGMGFCNDPREGPAKEMCGNEPLRCGIILLAASQKPRLFQYE